MYIKGYNEWSYDARKRVLEYTQKEYPNPFNESESDLYDHMIGTKKVSRDALWKHMDTKVKEGPGRRNTGKWGYHRWDTVMSAKTQKDLKDLVKKYGENNVVAFRTTAEGNIAVQVWKKKLRYPT